MDWYVTFVVGLFYIALIAAGAAAGTALVIGQRKTVGLAVIAAICILAGMVFAMSNLKVAF